MPSRNVVSVPGFPTEAPSIPHLGIPASAVSPVTGDEANYYFTSALTSGAPGVTGPVPQIPDEHEIFDVHAIRADFPILRETVNDNAATTQKPQAVIDRLAYFYAHENSNIHRAAHELAARATDAYEEARDTVRRFIGASKDENIIFVRGTTEAINLLAKAPLATDLRLVTVAMKISQNLERVGDEAKSPWPPVWLIARPAMNSRACG